MAAEAVAVRYQPENYSMTLDVPTIWKHSSAFASLLADRAIPRAINALERGYEHLPGRYWFAIRLRDWVDLTHLFETSQQPEHTPYRNGELRSISVSFDVYVTTDRAHWRELQAMLDRGEAPEVVELAEET